MAKNNKICLRCKIKKSLNQFYNDKTSKDNKHSWCKKCSCNASTKCRRKRFLRDPEYKKKCYRDSSLLRKEHLKNRKWKKKYFLYLREHFLKSHYNITLKIYNKLLIKQKYKCKICGSKNAGKRRKNFIIDHNHKTGNVRGLLCDRCNRGLGYFRENKNFLKKAIKYLG